MARGGSHWHTNPHLRLFCACTCTCTLALLYTRIPPHLHMYILRVPSEEKSVGTLARTSNNAAEIKYDHTAPIVSSHRALWHLEAGYWELDCSRYWSTMLIVLLVSSNLWTCKLWNPWTYLDRDMKREPLEIWGWNQRQCVRHAPLIRFGCSDSPLLPRRQFWCHLQTCLDLRFTTSQLPNLQPMLFSAAYFFTHNFSNRKNSPLHVSAA